jgi:hypothetical protein
MMLKTVRFLDDEYLIDVRFDTKGAIVTEDGRLIPLEDEEPQDTSEDDDS